MTKNSYEYSLHPNALGLAAGEYVHRERVVRNEARFRWAGVVHEAITPAGEIRWSDAAVSHKKEGSGDPDRNLCIYEAQLAAGKAL